MAVGYFIRLGDKTSCGGTVVSATSRIIHHGLNLARLGDKVTCGKNEGVFVLLGGISNYTSDGLPCIGTLESSSSCPCKARLFASEFSSSYYPEPPKWRQRKPLSMNLSNTHRRQRNRLLNQHQRQHLSSKRKKSHECRWTQDSVLLTYQRM